MIMDRSKELYQKFLFSHHESLDWETLLLTQKLSRTEKIDREKSQLKSDVHAGTGERIIKTS